MIDAVTLSAPDWAWWELAVMRALVVPLLFRQVFSSHLNRYTDQPYPVGLARLFDLTWVHRDPVFTVLRWLILPFGLLYALNFTDWLGVLGLGYLAVLLIVENTFSNAQGAVNHGRHLITVALAAELIGRLTFALLEALDRPGIDGLILDTSWATGTWWALQAMMALYFVSGVAKCARSGFWWIHDSPGFTADMVSRAEMAYQDRKADDTSRARSIDTATLLSRNPVPAMTVYGAGLALELFAPLALVDRWTMLIGGVLMISLHASIGVFLHLGFKVYRYTLLIYLVNVPYWAVELADALGVPESWLPG